MKLGKTEEKFFEPANVAMKLPTSGHLLLGQNLDYHSAAMFERYYMQSVKTSAKSYKTKNTVLHLYA
jgi:hypothetical protein